MGLVRFLIFDYFMPPAKYYFRSAAYSSLPSVAIDPWKF
jgi:hypothetical protein